MNLIVDGVALFALQKGIFATLKNIANFKFIAIYVDLNHYVLKKIEGYVKLNSRQSLNAVDLFAGAGGFSLAAQQAGLNVVLAVENDKWAAETYRNNFCNNTNGSGPTLYEDDIQRLDPDKLRSEHFESDTCDILLGGPPCQGFSSHRLKLSGVGDTRNSLIHTYFSFVKGLRPRLFLMENVPGMLWPRHKKHLDMFYSAGDKAGYDLHDPIILDARDYGVPQRRKRVFIFGICKSLNTTSISWPPEPSHGSEKAISLNSKLSPWVDCKNTFKASLQNDKNNIHMQHSKEIVEIFAKTPSNGGSRKDSGRILPCHKEHDGHKDVYGRINADLPAPTMTTACINPSKGRFVHPIKNHGITARQAARIQTFPDNFTFAGGLIASGVQIGNAVPILLGKILIEHLAQYLINLSDYEDLRAETISDIA